MLCSSSSNGRAEKCKYFHLLHQENITLISSDHYKFTSQTTQLKLEEKLFLDFQEKS
jgi:hypothetical protein